MTTTTTAAILREPEGKFSIEPVELADLGPKEVLVRIVGAGFCHTDMMPRGLAQWVLPAILGHEGSGIVEGIGSEVDGVRVGDSVVLTFASCGVCPQCVTAHPAYCVDFLGLNMSAKKPDGTTSANDAQGAPVANRWFGQSSFAHHAIVGERGVVVVDSDLPLETLGPLGCGIMTGAGAVLNVMDVKPGQSIVVFGAGAVGLAAVMAAKVAGATDIVAVDLHESRLDLARELGATRVVSAAQDDLREAIVAGGIGMDHALDTTGVASVMNLAVTTLAYGGGLILVGASIDQVTVHPTQLSGRRVTYVFEGDADPKTFVPYLITLWRDGRFPFDRLVKTYPFDQIDVAEADSKSGIAVKPVLLLPTS
ncbi:NAD(P)-dependent alcohol dehydrogenase [Rhodococcoides yunnanense]|uniref:NAD(P)-dependent alcohol dehydrogenase n=1 Tax=Rhodococcoides yunnanense TaxID=278209 RepID=UPI00093488FF|nr:NAD(P)-dependent alcohol dehydrogenase [Rhodococcus yunnanensis]